MFIDSVIKNSSLSACECNDSDSDNDDEIELPCSGDDASESSDNSDQTTVSVMKTLKMILRIWKFHLITTLWNILMIILEQILMFSI